MSDRLTPAELATLDADGYVVREGVFDGDEVRAIVDDCEALVRSVVAGRQTRRYEVGSYVFAAQKDLDVMIKWEGDTDVVHGLEPFAHVSPALRAWALDPRFVDPMVDFVGDPSPALFTEKLNLKRPRIGGVNPLHQDFPYWEDTADDATRVATAMLFLDDADTTNGTLEVVPGSHRQGRWRTRTDKDAFGNLEADPDAAAGIEPVPVVVPAGSVVFFGAFLVHQSAPNRSARERRSLLFSYQPAGGTHMVDVHRRQRAEAAAARSG